jgi:threonine dehydrogenase-like Zn-dependent dehydrogenase
MLSDIFPTGWHATELAGLKPGESVAIYGAGPVGLMAAHSAIIKGASQVFVVDTHTDRLALAEKMGATGINATGDEAVQKILDLTDGRGTDCGCECVGYQCCNKHGHEDNSVTMNSLVASTKATGGMVWLASLFLRIRGLNRSLPERVRCHLILGVSGLKDRQSVPARRTLRPITVSCLASSITIKPVRAK